MGTDASRNLYLAIFILTGYNAGGKCRSNRLSGEELCWVTGWTLVTNQALSCKRPSAWLGAALVSAEACAKYVSAYLQ